MRMMPLHCFRLFAAAVLLTLPLTNALAQDWPAKPITMIMGFPAGSGVDVVGRTLQESMEKTLNTRIISEYRSGAGGNLASEAVAKARPDGYTILLGTAATHGVNAALYKNLPFDVEADFTPIAPLVDVSNVLTVNPAVIDVKTVKEFIENDGALPRSIEWIANRDLPSDTFPEPHAKLRPIHEKDVFEYPEQWRDRL